MGSRSPVAFAFVRTPHGQPRSDSFQFISINPHNTSKQKVNATFSVILTTEFLQIFEKAAAGLTLVRSKSGQA